jgi:hypothetical protein
MENLNEFTSIITILGVFIANGALIIPLWLWNRSESRADNREIIALINAIQTEMKDFHGRLCSIEERNKKQ